MLKDILAKSDPDSRASSVLAVMSEDFDKAVRTLHYPLTPEVSFTSIKDLRFKLERTVKNMGQGGIRTLSVHGHGAQYANGAAIEMGNDKLHAKTINGFKSDLEAIGKLFGKGGSVQLLQCFAGSADEMMKTLASYLGVPVSGQIKLNGLSPVLEPIQNAVFAGEDGKKVVGAGQRTFSPDGSVK